MIKYEKDIQSRPARTWFQSEKERQKAKSLFQQLAPASERQLLAARASRREDGDAMAAGDDDGADDSDVNDINAEIAKAIAKPMKRSGDAGLSREQRRKKMMRAEEMDTNNEDFVKQQKSQMFAAKKAKRKARENTLQGITAAKAKQNKDMKSKFMQKKKASAAAKKPGMRFDSELTNTTKQTILGGRKGLSVPTSSAKGGKSKAGGGKAGKRK